MIGRKNIEITSKAFTTNVYNTRDNVDTIPDVDGLDFSTLFRLLKKYDFFFSYCCKCWLADCADDC